MDFAAIKGEKRIHDFARRAQRPRTRTPRLSAVFVGLCIVSGVITWPALSFRLEPGSQSLGRGGISEVKAGTAPDPPIGSTSSTTAAIRVHAPGKRFGGLNVPSWDAGAGLTAPRLAVTGTRPTTTADGQALVGEGTGQSTVSATSTTADASTGAQTDTTTTSQATTTTAGTTTVPTGGGACFQPSFRDDFDGDALSPNWEVYTGHGAHSPHAVRQAEAISVQNGMLTLTARNDSEGVLVSGGLRHNGLQKYGKYAFRVRTDEDMSNATSGVILTWPISNDQAMDGENNFYETLKAPGRRSPFYSFIHEPFDDRADGISQKRFVFEADATQWQEITAEWTPGYVQVTRTGPGATATETHRLDEDGSDRITDATHFLAIQLDLFKDSFPDDRQVKMEVDWVEIWSFCG